MNSSRNQNNLEQHSGVAIQSKKQYVDRLVACGNDEKAVAMLIERLDSGKPADKFEAAAMNSFVSLIADLTITGCRLTLI